MEFPITVGQLANRLGVEISTPRRWCVMFEKRNYLFERDRSGRRVFYEKDVKILEQFYAYCQNMKLEDALNAVFAGFDKNPEPTMTEQNANSVGQFVQEADALICSLKKTWYWKGADLALSEFEARWNDLTYRFQLKL
ncbi:MerR family transcriptional regulator [Paenibacillus elgii]|uniref:hypothetical protein n=1 Tax=Paenibacillus elgii TaxID=189691 RepID=UPI0013D6BBD3|nr:hypothetical protein [Paenibacillus elgii]